MELKRPEGLDEFAMKCAAALIVDSPIQFYYPHGAT